MDWLQIFVNLILTGILLYVFQRVIDERAEKRLEEFKSELRKNAFEKETKFSKLHEIHLDVIKELYKKIITLREAVNSVKLFVEDPDIYVDIAVDQRLSIAYDAKEDFRVYFQSNRLYIPEVICNQIESVYEKLSEIIETASNLSFDINVATGLKQDTTEYFEKYSEDLARSWLELSEKTDPLLKQLEENLRKLLGS